MKRGKDVIIANILKLCINGAGKTAIVYRVNLNFKTVNPFLELLINNGFIEVEGGPAVIYKTTAKGKELLSELEKIHKEFEKYDGLH